jgi:hypothetical protein
MHSSSLDLFRNYISDRRVISIDIETALELIDKSNLKIEEFNAELRQKLENTATGCLIFRLK